jgi:hypothetical protein
VFRSSCWFRDRYLFGYSGETPIAAVVPPLRFSRFLRSSSAPSTGHHESGTTLAAQGSPRRFLTPQSGRSLRGSGRRRSALAHRANVSTGSSGFKDWATCRRTMRGSPGRPRSRTTPSWRPIRRCSPRPCASRRSAWWPMTTPSPMAAERCNCPPARRALTTSRRASKCANTPTAPSPCSTAHAALPATARKERRSPRSRPPQAGHRARRRQGVAWRRRSLPRGRSDGHP